MFKLEENQEYLDSYKPEWEIRLSRETTLYFDATQDIAGRILNAIKTEFKDGNEKYQVHVKQKHFDVENTFEVSFDDLDIIYKNFPPDGWDVEISPV